MAGEGDSLAFDRFVAQYKLMTILSREDINEYKLIISKLVRGSTNNEEFLVKSKKFADKYKRNHPHSDEAERLMLFHNVLSLVFSIDEQYFIWLNTIYIFPVPNTGNKNQLIIV